MQNINSGSSAEQKGEEAGLDREGPTMVPAVFTALASLQAPLVWELLTRDLALFLLVTGFEVSRERYDLMP